MDALGVPCQVGGFARYEQVERSLRDRRELLPGREVSSAARRIRSRS